MTDCPFCKIINGDWPCFKVWEDDDHLAFLSIRPHHQGHTLVIPKKHQDYLFELEDAQLAKLMAATKQTAALLQQKMKPATGKVGLVVAGLEVPHVHVHLIPMDKETDLDPVNAQDATPEQLKEIQQTIVD